MMNQYFNFYLYKRIVQAKLFIDKHFAEPIDLNNIADEAYFSKFHFIRLFKKIYGKTPHQYLISVRIDHALKLLDNEVSPSIVCHSVGFESLTSFSGLFKRKVGSTPSEYLARQLLYNEKIKSNPLQFIPGCFVEKNGWAVNSNFEEARAKS